MPNNPRTQPDGTYVSGFSPSAADWRSLDGKIFDSVNGDRGGAYTLTEPMTIGGFGITVTGPTRLTGGGAIQSLGNQFVIRDGTWPKLGPTHVGSVRKIVQAVNFPHGPRPWLFTEHPKYSGAASIALASRLVFSTVIDVPELVLPLRVIDGAQLLRVDVSYRVLSPRDTAPLATPKFRVLRVPYDSFASPVLPLKATADGQGFDSPELPASGGEWYADGERKTFSYVCDQLTTIDVANYQYVLHIVEEQGAKDSSTPFDGVRFVGRTLGAGYRAVNTTEAFTGLSTVNTEGDTAQDGLRMLVTDSDVKIDAGFVDTSSERNGLWLQHSGAWTRADELKTASDFTPGLLVPLYFGARDGGTMWQLQYPDTTMKMVLDGASGSASRIRFAPPVARGNLYSTYSPVFAVTDLRFQ